MKRSRCTDGAPMALCETAYAIESEATPGMHKEEIGGELFRHMDRLFATQDLASTTSAVNEAQEAKAKKEEADAQEPEAKRRKLKHRRRNQKRRKLKHRRRKRKRRKLKHKGRKRKEGS